VQDCAVSPDGTWIVSASGGDDRTLKIWNAATGSERATLTGHTDQVFSCAVSPDGTWIVSASKDGTLKIWNAATGSERATLAGLTGGVWGCAVSPDGSWIGSVGHDGTLRIWDAATCTERAVLVLPGGLHAAAFHPFAPMVACGDAGGGVHLANLVGLELGPLVVTAAVRGDDLAVRCPACGETFPIDRALLGTEITCPHAACGRRIRSNSFTLQDRSPGSSFLRLFSRGRTR